MIEPELAAFLARHRPGASDTADWLDGQLHLRVTSYIADEMPPVAFINSVRAIVTRGKYVVVLRDRVGEHILPGGRREAGETMDATLRREVLEETGWAIGTPSMLGFMHFEIIPPRPPIYKDTRSGFINLVYVAAAATYRADAILPDDNEVGHRLVALTDVAVLSLTNGECLFLAAALARLEN